jgi:hypothetical protein
LPSSLTRAAPVRPIAHIISSAGCPVTVTTGVRAFAVILTCRSPAAEQQLAALQPLPERVGQAVLQLAGLPAIRPAPDVLVMDEELHQVEPLVHAGQPEDRQRRRPGADLLHQAREGDAGRQRLVQTPGMARQRPAHQAGRRIRPALPEHEMRGQVIGAPAFAQRRRVRSCLVQQSTQARSLVAGIAHPAMVRPCLPRDPPLLRRIGG